MWHGAQEYRTNYNPLFEGKKPLKLVAWDPLNLVDGLVLLR